MLAWVVVVVAVVIALGLKGRAVALEDARPRRFLTLLSTVIALAAVAYAVYRGSYWTVAFGLGGFLIVLPKPGTRVEPIAAEALAARVRGQLRDGRVLLIYVAQKGTLLLFRGRPGPLWSRRYRLLDQCPHCFVESWVSELFDAAVEERVIGHYRAELAVNRPVELQFTRKASPPPGAFVAEVPGDDPWVLDYYHPSNRSWPVAFPVACDVHNLAALRSRLTDSEE